MPEATGGAAAAPDPTIEKLYELIRREREGGQPPCFPRFAPFSTSTPSWCD